MKRNQRELKKERRKGREKRVREQKESERSQW